MKIHIILFTLLCGASSLAYACDGHKKGHGKKSGHLQSMTQEERAEFEVVRNKLTNMSKEERRAFKDKVKSQWSALSEAEKSDFISEHKQKIDKILANKKERVIMKIYGAQLLKNNSL